MFMNRTCSRKWLSGIVLVFALLGISVHAANAQARWLVESAPVVGNVIDSESKEPLEDVIVAIVWPQYNYAYGLRGGAGTMNVLETVTDERGYYEIPGWSKKSEVSIFTSVDPYMYFFKDGYEIKRVTNYHYPDFKYNNPKPWIPWTWKAGWSETTIELKKFEGDVIDYSHHISRLPKMDHTNGCNWMKVPRMIMALDSFITSQPEYIERQKRNRNTIPVNTGFRTMVPYEEVLEEQKNPEGYWKKQQEEEERERKKSAKEKERQQQKNNQRELASIKTIESLQSQKKYMDCGMTPLEYFKGLKQWDIDDQ
jgi:hypothetical protein